MMDDEKPLDESLAFEQSSVEFLGEMTEEKIMPIKALRKFYYPVYIPYMKHKLFVLELQWCLDTKDGDTTDDLPIFEKVKSRDTRDDFPNF